MLVACFGSGAKCSGGTRGAVETNEMKLVVVWSAAKSTCENECDAVQA